MSSTYYPPYHLGGDALHVKYLADELSRRGHEVHVFYSRDAYNIKKRRLPPEEKSDNVFVHEFKSKGNLSPYFAYFFGKSSKLHSEFNALVKEVTPEVIHHHNISLLGPSVLKHRGSNATLYTAHDYWLICSHNDNLRKGFTQCITRDCFLCALQHKKTPQLWRYNRNFKKSLKNLDLIIAPCHYLQEQLDKELALPSKVMRNFAPHPPSLIPKSDFNDYFLFVGALEAHKGVLNLLQIFLKYKEKINAKLLIVGDGTLKNYIKQFIQQHSLDNIVFLGSVKKDQLYSLYKGAYALLTPSIWPENSPLVVLEALSVGTPAIVSNNGGLPEIMMEIDGKLIFNNLSELEQLLVSFPNMNFNKSKVLEVYEKSFSPQAYIDQYFKAINEISHTSTFQA
jgi:glycosyltransferase involved in cell wall biosynthesis